MSTFFMRIEAIETRILLPRCPRGTAGRVCALRLRRTCRYILGKEPLVKSISRYSTAVHFHDGDDVCRKSIYNKKQFGCLLYTKDGLGQIPTPGPEPITNLLEEGSDLLKRSSSMIERPGNGNTLHSPKSECGNQDEIKRRLCSALQTGEPNIIFTTLTKLLENKGDGYRFLKLLPATMFSELLQSMNPNLFIQQRLQLHRDISPFYLEYDHFNNDDHIAYRFYTDFIHQILATLRFRRSVGLKPSLVDYKYLLRCARVGGSAAVSDSMWSAMLRDTMQPDTECYNHYLASKVKADLEDRLRKQNRRVISYHNFFQMRETLPSTGIKSLAIRTFDRMVNNGILGDEETFSLMMVALAREGEIDHVNGILARVWNIDVDRLMTNMAGIELAKTYEFGSPFRPSESLLLAVAHSYGINNQIPTALRLVDFISRCYSIKIPTAVWEELHKWTFLLSLKDSYKSQERDSKIGQLPPNALSDLWDTLIAEPYNVKPTMTMYHDLITNLIRRQRFGEAAKRLEEARLIHMKNVRSYANSVSRLDKQASFSRIDGSMPQSLEVEQRSIQSQARLLNLQREKTRRYQLMQQSRQCLNRLVLRYIRRSSISLGPFGQFSSVGLPEFIQRFKSYLPHDIKYKTATGEVRYESQSRPRNEARVQRLSRRRRPHLLHLWLDKKKHQKMTS